MKTILLLYIRHKTRVAFSRS